MDDGQGVLPVGEFFFVERVVLLALDLRLGALPQRDHGVEGFPLQHRLPLRLVVLTGVGGLLLLTVVLHLHHNGVTDIVGVFFDEHLQSAPLQILAVILILGVFLDVHDNIRAGRVLFAGRNGVAVGAGGLPQKRFLTAPGPRNDLHVIGHHEGGVKAHAELADHIHVVLFVPQLLLELERAAFGDGAQVAFQLLTGHADAVVGDGEGARVLVGDQGNFQVAAAGGDGAVCQGAVSKLVLRVAGVGDQLPEKDFLVGVDGVDH